MSTMARIITTCLNGHRSATVEGNRETMLALFDRALKQKPDLVCFPETFTGAGIYGAASAGTAETAPGPTTEAFARKAREHRCYVVCPIRTCRDGRQWNSAVVIDRSGEILGSYDKLSPVTTTSDYTDFEDGVTPGSEPRVFDLDFGRVGIQICFDAGFPEAWAALAEQGARLVLWPSAYHGGFALQAYAYLHHYYVVTAVHGDQSRIIDPCGRVVAETDALNNLAVRDVNLDFLVAHYDFNYSIPDRLQDAYPGRVRVTSYLEDAHFIVEPMDPALAAAHLQAEFDIESSQLYYERHRKAYAELRAGRPPLPQTAAHGSRAQYSK
jgi:predicted amidohydrolase